MVYTTPKNHLSVVHVAMFLVQPQDQLVAFQLVTAAHPLASLRCPRTWPWLPGASTEMRLGHGAELGAAVESTNEIKWV